MIPPVSRMILTLTLFSLLVGCAAPTASTTNPTFMQESPQPLMAATAVPTSSATSAPTATATEPAIPTASVEETNAVSSFEVEARIRQVEENLVPVMDIRGAEPQSMTLEGRMAYFNVPGISIAVVNEGKVEWAKGYGVLAAGSDAHVTPETLFQAASISKPVTALGIMVAAQEGLFDLDGDVNQWLKGWKAPLEAGSIITPRQLLSHTAGLGVHGFAGYPRGAELPTTEQILNGSGPANSAAVTLIHTPGTQFDYSGGGYVALQRLMMDASGQDFAEWMTANVFSPLGMENSLYPPMPEAQISRAASGHNFDGSTLEGGWRDHPELGPSGLWSTPSDLAQVLIEIDRADRGEQAAVLLQESAQAMLEDIMDNNGLGLVVPGGAEGQMFGHGGSNMGFRTLMFGIRGKGQAAVVMTNSDNGMELIFEIFRAIAAVYDWPTVEEWRPGERHRAGFVEVAPAVFTGLEGTYQMGELTFTIAAKGDSLLIHIPEGGPGYRLYPDSETDYFTADGAQFVFQLGTDGKAESVRMNGWGEAIETALRK